MEDVPFSVALNFLAAFAREIVLARPAQCNQRTLWTSSTTTAADDRLKRFTQLLSTMGDEQPFVEGAFTRLNAAMLRQGSWDETLVSFVGSFEDRNSFRCSDGQAINVSDEQYDLDNVGKENVVEIIGMVNQDVVSVSLYLTFLSFSFACIQTTSLTRLLFLYPQRHTGLCGTKSLLRYRSRLVQ